MFVAIMAFNARVSDPVVGGTYMTLLNTLSNLGGVWTSTTALWFVDVLTWKSCVGANTTHVTCSSKLNEKVCINAICLLGSLTSDGFLNTDVRLPRED
jgi:PAT family acetyl-CoA transporter-like MFS transporter 1